MAKNEQALSVRVLELEGALSAQYEAIESLRWAREQLERALQRVCRERDEARAEASRLQQLLGQRELPGGARARPQNGDSKPTVRLRPVGPSSLASDQNPTVPAPPREPMRDLAYAKAPKIQITDSGTYSVRDVTEEHLRPKPRPRRRSQR